MSLFDDLSRSLELTKLGLLMRNSQKGDVAAGSAVQVVAKMGSLRGLPQKIGQILSLRELSTDLENFSQLTEQETSVDIEEVIRVIERELGRPWKNHFNEISQTAFSASLGQVHRATLTESGKTVAVKIQYPNIQQTVESDLKALGLFSIPFSGKARGFDLSGYRAVLRNSLLDELDYQKELLTLRKFADRLQHDEHIVTPIPVEALSTKRMLTMSWVEGASFSVTNSWSYHEKFQAARSLLQFFLKSWLVWGEVHADPHSGNYRFQNSQGKITLGIIDFGCVKALEPNESEGLQNLIEWGLHREGDLLQIYTTMGFRPELLETISQKLAELSLVLLEPLLTPGVYDLTRWNLSSRIERILGEDRWNFRVAGPPSLFLFMRSVSGLIHYLHALDIPLNWNLELTRVMEEQPTIPPSSAQRETEILEDPRIEGIASHLKISVTENNQPKVQLTFGLKSVMNLEALMDEPLLRKLQMKGIEPAQLAKAAADEGYPKKELFSLEEEKKLVRVWLE
ncbi:MAG: AarF/ABC1/UbiB kinase family protein [Bdellovibrionales bacterium]|nr:AarF/ABC1/UbiB kinase family protein [Bdellovibrionales bacterium]